MHCQEALSGVAIFKMGYGYGAGVQESNYLGANVAHFESKHVTRRQEALRATMLKMLTNCNHQADPGSPALDPPDHTGTSASHLPQLTMGCATHTTTACLTTVTKAATTLLIRTGWSKKRVSTLLPVTSPNANRFFIILSLIDSFVNLH